MLVVLLKAGQKAWGGGGETFLAELQSIQVILFFKKKAHNLRLLSFQINLHCVPS